MVYKPVGWEVYDNHSPKQLVEFVRGHVARLVIAEPGWVWVCYVLGVMRDHGWQDHGDRAHNEFQRPQNAAQSLGLDVGHH